jgi:hypothetical protein
MSVKPSWVPRAFLFSCQKLTTDADLLYGPSGTTVRIEKGARCALCLARAVPDLENLTPGQIDVEDRGEADAGDPRRPFRGRMARGRPGRGATRCQAPDVLRRHLDNVG